MIKNVEPHNESDSDDFITRHTEGEALSAAPASEEVPTAKRVSSSVPATKVRRQSLIPPNIKVLGMDEQGGVWLWITDKRLIRNFSALKNIDMPTLAQLGGEWVKKPKLSIEDVRIAIALASRENAITWEKTLGQGIWSEDGLLIISGNQAAFFKRDGFEEDGEWNSLDQPQINDKLIRFNEGSQWVDLEPLLKRATSVTSEQARDAWARLDTMLSCWNFQFEHDRFVISGLMLATLIQAYLDFRPLTWLTGGTDTGKTAMMDFLERLFPKVMRFDNETTEAALRQSISNSSFPVLMDEFEKWKGRQAIIKLLRTSTRGGIILKGTPSGKPIHLGLRHIVWVASIEVGLTRAADKNRFILFDFDKPEKIVMPSRDELHALGLELLAVIMAIADPVRKLAEELGKTKLDGIDGRQVELFALPVAVWSVIHQKSLDETQAFLKKIIDERRESLQRDAQNDEELLIENILSSIIKFSGGSVFEEKSIGELLSSSEDYEGVLGRRGIRKLPNGRIFLAAQLIVPQLLKDTRWAEMNIGDILRRLEGAESVRQRVSGQNFRGISLPMDAFDLLVAEAIPLDEGVPAVPQISGERNRGGTV